MEGKVPLSHHRAIPLRERRSELTHARTALDRSFSGH
jgi:hypothetical protein